MPQKQPQPSDDALTGRTWPTVGIAMPTVNNSEQACQAMQAFFTNYPGKLVFAVVGNGTSGKHLASLKDFQALHPDSIRIVEFAENKGYGAGCNAGLKALEDEGGWDLLGITNDDVFPASSCLVELVAALQELDALGHRPGLIGPVSNNINGPQQRNIGDYSSPVELETRAKAWHEQYHESVAQVAQLRGLFFLMTRACFEAIGGFDERFGIGNFEDDDLNLRARLAGFTLWIADGAFLHHYGSTTFKSLGIDYAANMQRNAETFMRKWHLERLEDWPSLAGCPVGTSLHCPVSSDLSPQGFRIQLNGESVDLVEQASDVEFAAWIISRLSSRPRQERRAVLECVEALTRAA